MNRKSEALLSAPLGTSDPGPEHKGAEPQGAREAIAAGCHATPPAQGIDLPLIQRGCEPKTGLPSLRLRAAMMRVGSRDCKAVKLLSTQIVRNTGESNRLRRGASCLQDRRQRFPTVRSVAQLGNSEVRAKTVKIRTCTSTVFCKP
jgi:hypothetical protein